MKNTVLNFYRTPGEPFRFDWVPWSKKSKWKRGYLRVRFFTLGFNFYYGQNSLPE